MSEDQPAFACQTQGDRDAKGRFTRGRSGNPAGMAPGTKRRATILLEQFLEERGEELLRHAVDVAMTPKGAPTLRALLPLLVGPRTPRGEYVRIELPPLSSAAEAARAAEVVLAAVAAGEITVETSQQLIAMLTNVAKVREVADVEARLAAIEAAQQKGGSP